MARRGALKKSQDVFFQQEPRACVKRRVNKDNATCKARGRGRSPTLLLIGIHRGLANEPWSAPLPAPTTGRCPAASQRRIRFGKMAIRGGTMNTKIWLTTAAAGVVVVAAAIGAFLYFKEPPAPAGLQDAPPSQAQALGWEELVAQIKGMDGTVAVTSRRA